MGLFDIFRRKNKENQTEANSSAVKENSQSADEIAESQAEGHEESSTAAAPSETPASLAASSETSASDDDQSSSADDQVENKLVSAASAVEQTTEESTKEAINKSAVDSQEPAKIADSKPVVDDAENDSPTPEPEKDDSTETESAEEPSVEERYDRGLEKSRHGFGARLNQFLANFRRVDEDFFDDLEDLLIESDVGYDMTMTLSDALREEVKLQNAKSKQDVSNVIIQKMLEIYDQAGDGENNAINFAKSGPTVIMFVGVNGAGKTTTIGKLAARYKKAGKKVLLAAADTFRAGAIQQLAVWAERDGVDIVKGREHGDPAAVVFDAVKKAKAEQYDVLLVDTAGRLQNKTNLMNELAKMKRVLTREIPDAPHEVLLVLDATTGQNALNQAKLFKESTDVTGIVLTKLDGTARGGIVLAIRNELHLPVKLVGLGEKVDDLQDFDPADFVYGLFKGLVEEN